jgi:hypothetical protein
MMPAVERVRLVLVSIAVLVAGVLGYCVAFSPVDSVPKSVATGVDHADDRQPASSTARGPAESVTRTLLEPGDTSKDASARAIGPASPEVVRKIEIQLRQSLESCREIAARASEDARGSFPSYAQLYQEGRAKYDLLMREFALRLLERGAYVEVRNGAERPPVPRGAETMLCGGFSDHGAVRSYLFVFLPGEDPAFDAARSYVIEVGNLWVDQLAGEFNNLPYEERRQRIETHDQARAALTDEYRKSSSVPGAVVKELEAKLIDRRLAIVDRVGYRVAPARP